MGGFRDTTWEVVIAEDLTTADVEMLTLVLIFFLASARLTSGFERLRGS